MKTPSGASTRSGMPTRGTRPTTTSSTSSCRWVEARGDCHTPHQASALLAHDIWLMLKLAYSRGGLTGHVRTQQCQYFVLACCTARQKLIRKHEQQNRQQSDPSQIPQGGCMWQWDFAVLVSVCSLSARCHAQAWLCTLCVLAVEPIAGGAHGIRSAPT